MIPMHSAKRQRKIGTCPYGHTSVWRQRPGDGRATLILRGGDPAPKPDAAEDVAHGTGSAAAATCVENPDVHLTSTPILLSLSLSSLQRPMLARFPMIGGGVRTGQRGWGSILYGPRSSNYYPKIIRFRWRALVMGEKNSASRRSRQVGPTIQRL